MTVTSVPLEERLKRIRDDFIMLVWVFARLFSQELQRFGLTLPQFVALAALAGCKEACTMSDLTRVTLQDAPTMTGITDRLVKMKLVERTRSEADRRVVLVRATPPGIELLNQIRNEVLERTRNDYLAWADNDELTDLDRLLEFFEQSLEYILRIHLKRRHSLDAPELDVEIEKIRSFLKSPIHENESEAQQQTVSPLR
jgi:DNA-binding MarR family transcriptional regulator